MFVLCYFLLHWCSHCQGCHEILPTVLFLLLLLVPEFHAQKEPPKVFNFIKNQTLAQVFSCEFLEILRTRILQNTSGRLLLHVADEEAAIDSHQADKTVFEKENSI